MNLQWKGKTPVQVGDRVELFDEEGKATSTERVQVTLAAQFITNRGTFLLYTDKGATWNLQG